MKKKFFVQILIGMFVSAGITLFLFWTDFTPVGKDIFGHLYKAEILYDNIKQFNFYPLYTTEWYNGIQLFRYWPVFTYYVLAFITVLTKDVFVSYYIYAGLTFFLGYLGWILIGKREQKSFFVAIGLVYWFLPDNLRVFFLEGNLSRVMIMAMLPIFLYFYTNLIEKKKNFIVTTLLVALLTATHFMLAAMCAIIFVIYGFFKGIKNNTQFYGFYSFVCGFLIAGILLIPGLSGGLVSDTSSAAVETIADWSQPLLLSVSPFNRMATKCSFGLGMLVLCIAGIVMASRSKAEKSGLITGLVFFVLSDSMFTIVFKQMPMSQVFWMARFVQMSYVLILYDFGRLDFKQYRNYLILAVVIADILPSLSYFMLKDDLTGQEEKYLLREAVELTDNRLGLVDESEFGSYPAYFVLKEKIPYIEGWAIQGAATSENIVSITEAVKKGYYRYAFDQLLSLGADTVIIKKEFIKDMEGILSIAEEYGYEFITENEDAILLDLRDVTGTFGVVSEYRNLAIGSSSIYISYQYPSFKQGESDNLLDYTFEELVSYQKIYLSNFTYDDEEKAQDLINRLADAGVEIYIDATHMPVNVLSISEFLGVESRFISIYDFKELRYKDQTVKISIPYEWYTTYLVVKEDEDAVCQTYDYGSQKLNYIVQKGNVTFIGFNLIYLNYEEDSIELGGILDDIFHIEEEDRVVLKRITPIQISYGRNRIFIQASERVNTTIAFQDNFQSDQTIESENNLLVVENGRTVITIVYKHFLIGLLCSLIGYATMLLAYWKINVR